MVLFPFACTVTLVTGARVIDRIGKGLRDAPRDAFLTDVTPARVRGSGFGLRLTFYTAGYVVGPPAAIGLKALIGDDLRLVFWIAVIPSAFAIVVLFLAIKEGPPKRSQRPLRQCRPRLDRHHSLRPASKPSLPFPLNMRATTTRHRRRNSRQSVGSRLERLKCESDTYRVRLIPDMAARVERID